MKRVFLLSLFILVIRAATCQQSDAISISLGTLTCKFRDDLRGDAEKAFRIMSQLFSSQEFQDSLRRLSFSDNSCNDCGSSTIVSGGAILEVLFSKKHDTWNMIIKRKGGALGETIPEENYTTAFYKNIKEDMCNLPFAVGLAVNLSHEYMHHICFCHPKDPKDKSWRKLSNGNRCEDELYDPISYRTDVAYRVGWIAYDILLRWHKEGRIFD